MITITPEEREYVRSFINDNCIERRPKGSTDLLRMEGAGYYVWQFYLRAVMYDVKALNIITKDFFLRNRGVNFSAIRLAGIESSSVPLLTAFSQEAHRYGVELDIISVRKTAKTYGLQQWVEGKVDFRPVMIVDDLISDNHKWNNHVVWILEKSGVPILDRMYSIVNKHEKPTRIPISGKRTAELVSMFNLNDFELDYAKYEFDYLRRNP